MNKEQKYFYDLLPGDMPNVDVIKISQYMANKSSLTPKSIRDSEDGVGLIAAERNTHISKGYDAAHDALHYDGCIADMAAIYATTHRRTDINGRITLRQIIWGTLPSYPYESAERRFEDWFTEQPDRITELVKAGALIVAEIDRLLLLESELAKEVNYNK